MNNILEYLKYLRRSTNQHGVHSPFVFELVTKAFYAKNDDDLHPALNKVGEAARLPQKYLRPLNRALYHLIGTEDPGVVNLNTSPMDPRANNALLCADLSCPDTLPDLLQIAGVMTDRQVLLVLKQGTPTLWSELIASEHLHLTIDCFRFGLAFRRPQQAKEHFTIRL